MTKKAFAAAVAVVAVAVAAPAAAVTTTFALVGTTGSAVSYTYTNAGGNTLNVTAGGYSGAPSLLTTLGQITFAANANTIRVRRFAAGTPSGNPGGLGAFVPTDGEADQVDTNGANELLRAGLTDKKSILKSATFNFVDSDDTLRLYGVNGNVMTLLGFAGEFAAPPAMTGGATAVGGAGTGNNRAWTVTFANLGKYDSYIFTANNDAADGYRLNSVSLSVPEPASWAMMVGGFGLLGAAARRRRSVTTVYA